MATTPDSIALELGRPSPTDVRQIEQWDMWIADARRILAVGDGHHTGLGDLSLLDQDTLDYVVRQAVVEHVRNPENVTQIDVSVDNGSTSRRYASGPGRVTILPEWWGMLDPSWNDKGAFSVTPTGNPYVAVAFNVNTGYGYDPLVGFPFYPWDVNP